MCGSRNKDVPVKRLHHETSNMVISAGVLWRWKQFIDTSIIKVNSEKYIKLVNRGLVQDRKRVYLDNDNLSARWGNEPQHS